MKYNIVIADKEYHHRFIGINAQLLEPLEYIALSSEDKKFSANIFNLGELQDYQSMDYYVSLLAHARGHRVFPDIGLIQDLKYKHFHSFYTDEVNFLIQKQLKRIQSDTFELSCYFGENPSKSYNLLCSQFFKAFPAPLFRVFFSKTDKIWNITKIKLLSLDEISDSHLDFISERMKHYFSSSRRYGTKKPKYLMDIAIWLNHDEENPPSNEKAIQKFINAGQELNVNLEVLTKKDEHYLLEFDGLFIRETTRLNHVTYKVSRKAQAEGLIVVDDPESIIKCTNKVFLDELLSQKKIPRPKAHILHKKNYTKVASQIVFPCILKKPDSAFSQGVFKAKDIDEYTSICSNLFKHSDLILAQEYLFTDFDWRIGILNNQALYACKYYMAHNHWQIVNHKDEDSSEGPHECVPLDQVPPQVIKYALRACESIGKSLYGVDLKEVDNKPYLIEVNDNPNIDSGVEDDLLGDLLYEKIVSYFLERFLKKRGNDG